MRPESLRFLTSARGYGCVPRGHMGSRLPKQSLGDKKRNLAIIRHVQFRNRRDDGPNAEAVHPECVSESQGAIQKRKPLCGLHPPVILIPQVRAWVPSVGGFLQASHVSPRSRFSRRGLFLEAESPVLNLNSRSATCL